MQYSTFITASGIVRCDIFSNNFKTDCITVNLFMPLDIETASSIALLSAVLKRGNEKFGEMDKIGAFLEKNYGASLSVSTSKAGELQSLSFTIRFLSDRFAIEKEPVAQNLVSLLYSCIFEPITEKGGFKASFVEQEKQNLKDKIASIINDKRVYSLEKCKQAMFEHERYGVYEYGDINMIDKITPQGLYRFYQKLINSAALFISYAGFERDTSGLLKPLCDKFEVQKRPLPKTTVINEVSGIKEVTEEMNVAQSKLNLGFRLGKAAQDDLFATKMFNVIFGSSPTSKLFMNVREKLSLCYYCSSICDTLKNVMFVYSGVETENVGKAQDEILKQLEHMKNGEFTDEEFENARAYLIDSYVQSADSLSTLLFMQTAAYLAGHKLTDIQQIEEIKKVTKQRVAAVAREVALDTVYLLKGVGGDKNAN